MGWDQSDVKHGKLLKEILDNFCDVSGHNVNSWKTNMFFSKGVQEPMTNMLTNLLGFQKLSIAVRATLALSVLLLIPNYFMQSMMIPKKICDEIENLVRKFIWGASDNKKKMSLMGWDSICEPKWCGGLEEGIWNLNLLQVWLPDDLIQLIVGIPPQHPSEGSDRLSWHHTSTGAFSIKSAYKMMKESWNSRDETWKKIWKFLGSQRV
ncbi:hypothetical protein J1N35_014707 [Gossypium stocksii]|uniref:Reverse transcriptase zinc-binding domain-containing protein n=1 Tax=Gossypium stocksii TaxID=47602 RepID=A0A9D3VX15_9ROSI|nr:hypothetical protein J1N35_014707 [Gossypium stocksii]